MPVSTQRRSTTKQADQDWNSWEEPSTSFGSPQENKDEVTWIVNASLAQYHDRFIVKLELPHKAIGETRERRRRRTDEQLSINFLVCTGASSARGEAAATAGRNGGEEGQQEGAHEARCQEDGC